MNRHTSDKLGKLQKFLRRPMTAKVTCSIDRLKHICEVRISSGGEHLEAKESGEDMYVSIDRVMEKLERQIRGVKGAAQARRRHGETVREVARSAAGARGDQDEPAPLAKPKAGAKKRAKAARKTPPRASTERRAR
jgi:ribosomal subunit interface protein